MSLSIRQASLRSFRSCQRNRLDVATFLLTLSRSSSRKSLSTQSKGIWPLHSTGYDKHLNNGELSRRNCILTGGTSGIGFEIAKQLIVDGASSVRLIVRDVGRGERTIEALKRETGFADAPVGLIEGDLSSVDGIVTDWSKHTASIKEDPDKVINTLINCAGISQNQLLQRISSEEIAKILELNLQAPIELSKAFLNAYQSFAMQRRNVRASSELTAPSFCVVNVSSLLAYKTIGPGTSIYTASKAGLAAFTRSLVVEGAHLYKRYMNDIPPFRANVVVPGYIETRMTSDFSNTRKNTLLDTIPMGRFGSPQEVAKAVTFLLRNEYANNCLLNLDGGLSAT